MEERKTYFSLPDTNYKKAQIKVIGVGGCGGNTINYMTDSQNKDVSLIAANTDMQALEVNKAKIKIQLGPNRTKGYGAGGNPEVAKEAAEESKDEIKDAISGCNMLFITAGLGGGTGTGSSPIVAQIAKEMDILTVAIVLTPFSFEGNKKNECAAAGLEELSKYVDSMLVISNDKIFNLDNKIGMDEAYKQGIDILKMAVQEISNLITVHGHINLDFEDIKRSLKDSKNMILGTGIGEGENKAEESLQNALNHHLLGEISIRNAQRILFNISTTRDASMKEYTWICNAIKEAHGGNAEFLYGHCFDDSLKDKIKTTIIATNYDENNSFVQETVAKKQTDNKIKKINFSEKKYFVKKAKILSEHPDLPVF